MLFEVSAVVPPVPYIPVPVTAGLVTVTGTVAGAARLVAAIAAVTWFALTHVVVCAAPFQFMTDLAEKLLPFTVSVNPALPDGALSGARAVMAGIIPAVGGVLAALLEL
jgi:hypothetical protein